MNGYMIEYWPGTRLVKCAVSVASADEVPKGFGFVPEGEPLPENSNPPPIPEQLLSSARAERDRLLAYATLRIDPLQDDVDNDEATPEGAALLKAWKKYRSAVNKTEDNPGWPESPQWPTPPVPIETVA